MSYCAMCADRLRQINDLTARVAELEGERDEARTNDLCALEAADTLQAQVDKLTEALNPRMWTREMSDAWHKAIPDTQAAFDALLKAALGKVG